MRIKEIVVEEFDHHHNDIKLFHSQPSLFVSAIIQSKHAAAELLDIAIVEGTLSSFNLPNLSTLANNHFYKTIVGGFEALILR